MTAPKHEDIRNHRTETEVHTVGGGFPSAVTYTIYERYCAGCDQWFEVKGVTGFIEWLCKHREHHK